MTLKQYQGKVLAAVSDTPQTTHDIAKKVFVRFSRDIHSHSRAIRSILLRLEKEGLVKRVNQQPCTWVKNEEIKMPNEQEIEKEIQAKGLNAPRLTPEYIDSTISSEEYAVFSGRMTVCVMTLKNGFLVTGESSCVSAANFDAELGRNIARDNAKNKVWELEGYLLADRLYNQSANK